VRDDAKIARQLNGHESATIRVPLHAVNPRGSGHSKPKSLASP